MIIVGIDLETTGLDFKEDRIIEIALVLYDTELKIPLKMFSEFINEPNRPKIDRSKVAADITDEMLDKYGALVSVGFLDTLVGDYFSQADYIVAQNGNQFDKPMLQNFFNRYEYEFPSVPWIDTRTDISYPEHCASRNLIYLAAFHGFVNPFPHRALFDTLTMLRVLSNYDIDVIVERMKSPTITLRAKVSYKDKDLAKVEKFVWDPDAKIWYKDMKDCDITEAYLEGLGFSVKVVTTRER